MKPKNAVSATEANRSFSAVLERVKRGEVVSITSHGKTVAEIRPKRDDEDQEKARKVAAWKNLLVRLESQKFEVIGPWSRAELYERD